MLAINKREIIQSYIVFLLTPLKVTHVVFLEADGWNILDDRRGDDCTFSGGTIFFPLKVALKKKKNPHP